MKTIITLVKRELWQYHASFIRLPLLLSGLIVISGLIATITAFASGHRVNLYFFSDNLNLHNYQWPYALFFVRVSFNSIYLVFMTITWIAIAHYFLGCLFEDRQDRSILFWHSLPISTTQEIVAKLITGAVVAPLISFGCIIIVQILINFMYSALLVDLGSHLAWLNNWQPAALLNIWFWQLLGLSHQGIWLFPIIGWLMLWSAYSQTAPFVKSVVILIILIIIEAILFNHGYLLNFILTHINQAFNNGWALQSHANLPSHFNDPLFSLFLGLIVGLIGVVSSGILRAHQD